MIAAHNMPPTTPARITGTTIHAPVLLSASSATPPAKIAPRMYCPSAPMFQTLERKHTASPSAMISSGVALTSSSPTAYPLLIGCQKNISRPRSGSFPSATNRMIPITTVITSASSGEP